MYRRPLRRRTLPPSECRCPKSSSPADPLLGARRAALIRAASCIQLELDIEKKDIQIYSLHPGGVRTDMTLAALDPALDELLPGVSRAVPLPLHRLLTFHIPQTVERVTEFFHQEMNIEPELCAATCVFLATTEKAKELRGSYFDVSHVSLQHISDRAGS